VKADTVDLAEIFGQNIHYVVPLYQRPYVWDREHQWEPLWENVRTVADRQLDGIPSNDNIPHFLGAVVREQSLHQVGNRAVPAARAGRRGRVVRRWRRCPRSPSQ
jgi:hypothetical protein